MSPFSSTISLKNIIGKDKSVVSLKSSHTVNDSWLEGELYSLHMKHEKMLKDYEKAKGTITVLQD